MNLSIEPEYILCAAAAFYALVAAGLLVGLGRLRYKYNTERPFVSVIVAARNEEDNVANLLTHLLAQDYSSYEVLMVNDRSTDRTPEIIEHFSGLQPSVRHIDIADTEAGMPAKKHALSRGIAESRGEILCFTDADCMPPPHWITSLVSAFDKDVGIVAGYSPYLLPSEGSGDSWKFSNMLQSFISYEELKGATWAAASIGLQRGWLCTGRSLAYRRQVYDEVGGFDRIKQSISGDDDLFLQLVRASTSWEIRYVTMPESHVPTSPPADFGQFVRQRVRHFSAGKFFSLPLKTFFLFYHLANLLLLVALLDAFTFGISSLSAWPFLAKSTMDAILFRRAATVFNHPYHRFSFIVFEIVYVIYNTIIGPLGFVSRVDWKTGRPTP